MKRIWIALALLALVIATCVMGICYTREITEKMTQTVQEAKDAEKRGDIDTAYELSITARKDWKNAHNVLCVYMVHNDLEEIDQTLALLPELCLNGAKDTFLSECDRGLTLISSLDESVSPKFENVF
jgi:PBP1b-binding outer membrane lipoprotein LpoB